MLFLYHGDTMNNKDLMYKFIKDIEASKLTTNFICDILKYQELNDYNYIFRIKEESTNIIIDIYDNISINRFNRYIFHFSKPKNKNDITITEKNNVFVTDINVLNSSQNNDNNLVKLAYLFNINKKEMSKYSKTFLSSEIVKLLDKLINKI